MTLGCAACSVGTKRPSIKERRWATTVVEVDGKELFALFDLGASVNGISRRLATALGAKVQPWEGKIIGFDGEILKGIVGKCTLRVRAAAVEKDLQFLVSKNCSEPELIISDLAAEELRVGSYTTAAGTPVHLVWPTGSWARPGLSLAEKGKQNNRAARHGAKAAQRDISISTEKDDLWESVIDPKLPSEKRTQLVNLLNEYRDLFADSLKEGGRSSLGSCRIKLSDERQVVIPSRRMPANITQAIREEISKMLSAKVIEPSKSWWNSPIVAVRKKDGTYRICIDYREVNRRTIPTPWLFPRTDEILERMAGSSYFSKVDAAAGYWQVQLEPESRESTAFSFAGHHYQFTAMPFGLMNAPAVFQRGMDYLLEGPRSAGYAVAYIDDTAVYSRTWDDHLTHLRSVLSKFREANVVLKRTKCTFGGRVMEFLGHKVSSKGIEPQHSKQMEMQKLPVPSTIGELRYALGLFSYYRKFVPRFSEVARPLNKLTEAGIPFRWGPEQQVAWERLRRTLAEPVVLAPFNDAEGSSVTLSVDASIDGFGVALSQFRDGHQVPVMFCSRATTPQERNYSNSERELRAVVYGLEELAYYTSGRKVVIETDHKALESLLNRKRDTIQTTARMVRLRNRLYQWLS